MSLRKMTQRDPTAAIHFDLEFDVVDFTVGWDFFLRDSFAIHHNLDKSRSTFDRFAAVGVGSSRAEWRFDRHKEPLFGRDVETWTIVAQRVGRSVSGGDCDLVDFSGLW